MIFLTVLIFQNCGPSFNTLSGSLIDGGGTDTGNPSANPNEIPTIGTRYTTIAEALTKTICRRVHQCQPAIDENTCAENVKNLNGLPSRFGAQLTSSGETLAALMNLESRGEVHGDSVSAASCQKEISALSCEEKNLILLIIDPSRPEYDRLLSLIPVNYCSDVYNLMRTQ